MFEDWDSAIGTFLESRGVSVEPTNLIPAPHINVVTIGA